MVWLSDPVQCRSHTRDECRALGGRVEAQTLDSIETHALS